MLLLKMQNSSPSKVITGAELNDKTKLPLYCLPGFDELVEYRDGKINGRHIYNFPMILQMKDFIHDMTNICEVSVNDDAKVEIYCDDKNKEEYYYIDKVDVLSKKETTYSNLREKYSERKISLKKNKRSNEETIGDISIKKTNDEKNNTCLIKNMQDEIDTLKQALLNKKYSDNSCSVNTNIFVKCQHKHE